MTSSVPCSLYFLGYYSTVKKPVRGGSRGMESRAHSPPPIASFPANLLLEDMKQAFYYVLCVKFSRGFTSRLVIPSPLLTSRSAPEPIGHSIKDQHEKWQTSSDFFVLHKTSTAVVRKFILFQTNYIHLQAWCSSLHNVRMLERF